jgi:hypothetical protein
MSQDDACPVCRGGAGTGSLRIQTWTYQDTEIIRGRDRYLLRTRDLANLCAGCDSSIARGRWIADFACLAPLVALFLTGVFMDSKPVMAVVLAYLIYLGRKLDYGWADRLFYGNDLEQKLGDAIPPGDLGGTTFPTNWGHVAVRVLAIPVGLVAIATVGGSLLKVLPKTAPTPAATARAWPADRLAHAKMFFEVAQDVAVSVDLDPFPMGGQKFMRLRCWDRAALVPSGASYRLMSGGQVARAFLKTPGATLLFVAVEDGTALVLYRFEVEKLTRGLPEAPPTPDRVHRKP